MSITVTKQENIGQKLHIRALMAMDNAYVTGGEPVTAAMFGLSELEDLIIETPARVGTVLAFDAVNKKVKAFKVAMPTVEEEVVTVTANVGVLANNAASIMSVYTIAGKSTTVGNKTLVPLSLVASPATTQVSFDLTPASGNTSLKFNAATDAVTEAVVTYVKAVADMVEVAAGVSLASLTDIRVIAIGY